MALMYEAAGSQENRHPGMMFPATGDSTVDTFFFILFLVW
jgi:hypothetical protein